MSTPGSAGSTQTPPPEDPDEGSDEQLLELARRRALDALSSAHGGLDGLVPEGSLAWMTAVTVPVVDLRKFDGSVVNDIDLLSWLKSPGRAVDDSAVADVDESGPPAQAEGFSIPMTTDEQVARRDALRERARTELARRKAASAS
jgi:hypothetical protein